MTKQLGVALWLALAAGLPALAEQTVTLASLEWPPYAGKQLPDQGASSAVVKAAFAAMGYRLHIEFVPWSRAVQMARDGRVAGYFPEYHSGTVAARFTLSDPIGEGPLGLAQRTTLRIPWNNLSDLARWRVGVVQDYVNTAEFDARVAGGQQRVDVSLNDRQNLLKLAASRVDLAIIDPHVFGYLRKHDQAVAAVGNRLEMNPRLLETKDLFVCFARSEDGERWARVFNEGLKKVDVAAVMRKYLTDYRAAGDKRARSTNHPPAAR